MTKKNGEAELTPDQAIAAVAQVDLVRDMIIQLLDQVNTPKNPDDWKVVDENMLNLISDASTRYGEQMAVFFDIIEKIRVPQEIHLALTAESIKMTAIFSILKSHLCVAIQRGRQKEAHLHLNRVTEFAKSEDARFLREMHGVKGEDDD